MELDLKGLHIFRHSVRQVTGNLEGAIRVSGLLYAVQAVVGLIFGLGVANSMGAGLGGMTGGMGLGVLITLLVAIVTGLWIAVGWHRYVLLNEKPDLLPAFRQDRMLAYFLRSLLLGLIILLPAIVWGMVIGVIFSGLFHIGLGLVGVLLMTLIIQLPLVFAGLRLSAALPGQALGVESEVLAGWRATAHDNRALAELTVIVVVAIFAVNLIGMLVFGHLMITAILWQLVTNWLITMVGVSILTTLYGHYIEKRPLV